MIVESPSQVGDIMASKRDIMDLNYPVDSVFTAAIDALHVSGAEVTDINEEARIITAKKAMRWNSWGERITVRVEEVSPDRAIVSIESRARKATQFVDWGQNARNIRAFEAALCDALKQTK
jgi:exosome complex RNA-binding protein Csl4